MLDLTDTEVRPASRRCSGCDRELPWNWGQAGRRPDGSREEQWIPTHDPCPNCQSMAERQHRERIHLTALKVSGLPPKLQGWTFERVATQRPGEQLADFTSRIPPQTIGVLRDNAPAFVSVNQWQGESLYLHGEVGRGKSTLVAALVNRLAVPPEMTSRPYTADELMTKYRVDSIDEVPITARKYHRKGIAAHSAGGTLYIDESELQARVKLSWSGDRDPLLKVTKKPVLVLDDLGKGKLAPWWLEAVEKLVCFRYDHELPLIITSNKPWSELADYGARTASRLTEMVSGGHFRVYGPDWRQR